MNTARGYCKKVKLSDVTMHLNLTVPYLIIPSIVYLMDLMLHFYCYAECHIRCVTIVIVMLSVVLANCSIFVILTVIYAMLSFFIVLPCVLYAECHYAECHYAECHMCYLTCYVMLRVIMPSVRLLMIC